MATTVSSIRTGIANNLTSIANLRVSPTMLDAPRPPVAMVYPSSIDFDLNANRGADTYIFIVYVLVGRADDRTSQNRLDGFVSGASSVKTAIEADRTLGGAADTCRVTNMSNYQQVTIGETVYLGVEFEVEVVG
jgi:hypothetical protein